ncbi:beta-ketoacyl synthase N-terminal-like domain-containing protein [Nocardia asteroides]|uniref:beta-ketoacyl synthase N-terminal-like domain-containing protein n=1 Tax=Nocardia asteroides TaxID=1824 RepID=UPI001E4C9C52|nr:beta-ketoacyl synthase N-terminal-like domain-containing protein [Nocardia asteroides]UGT62036.1 thioesterase domain-containing protein [Nocardia asteroides]
MEPFAIVGAALALPGVEDLDRFRADLLAGTTHFGPVPRVLADDNEVPVASVLPEAELFDREFFGLTATEARWTDPQQRLLLRLAHEALESTGIARSGARIGVYATASASTWLHGRVAAAEPGPARVDYRALLGNDRDFLATRIAYRLGCTGPALTVQSACSSSLVALHQACLGLAFGDADTAVVGAASLAFPQEQGYLHEAGGILSATGRSRPFDAAADGTVRGSGGGVVVVRRLADARADGDPVLAVIAGSAINNDGAQRMAYSAPAVGGQRDVLAAALDRAGITPGAVGYLETHGTGTPLGDPIEFRALSRAYADPAARRCYLGAAKAGYGHLDVAAGMVGLLKAVLVLRGGTIFPQPAFTAPNPAIPLADSRFAFATEPVPVADLEYAAVSSFGMGGTNGHVVLRRAEARAPGPAEGGPVPVVVSARSADGLRAYRQRLAEYLRANPELAVRDIAATLDRRVRHEHVWSGSAVSAADLAEQLALEPVTGSVAARPAPVTGTAEPGAGERIWLPPSPLNPQRLTLPLLAAPAPAPEDDAHALFVRLAVAELGGAADEDTDFFAAGGESMTLVALVGTLTDSIGFRVDFDALDGVSRIGDLAAILAGQARAKQTPAPGGDLLVLGAGEPLIYLYPPAGGTNFGYTALQRAAPRLTLAAFRAVRGAHTVEEIAAACLRTLRERGAVSPELVLGGYSFGGNVAFEMARQLDADGTPPAGLVLIDSFPPQAFGAEPVDPEALSREVGAIARTAAAELPGTDPAGVLAAFESLWLANTKALRAYRPATPISVPITVLRAEIPLTPARARAVGIDPATGTDWSRWTRADVRTFDTPGDHYTVLTEQPCRAAAAELLERALRTRRTIP